MLEALDGGGVGPIPLLEVLLRLSSALLFGAVVGWEREAKNRPAGLRTHMLVALGAAGLMLLGHAELLTTAARHEPAEIDTLRIVQAVAIGISFLGAGSIVRANGGIEGLTTGASIWAVGAVGMACGAGHFVIAILLALGMVFVLGIVLLMER